MRVAQDRPEHHEIFVDGGRLNSLLSFPGRKLSDQRCIDRGQGAALQVIGQLPEYSCQRPVVRSLPVIEP